MNFFKFKGEIHDFEEKAEILFGLKVASNFEEVELNE